MKKFLCVIFVVLLVASLTACAGQSEPTNATLPHADIVKGMTYSAIVDALGMDGTAVGSGTIIYEWAMGEGDIVTVWFTNPKNPDGVTPDDLVAAQVVRTESPIFPAAE